jgi:hypothetical protein
MLMKFAYNAAGFAEKVAFYTLLVTFSALGGAYSILAYVDLITPPY